MEEEAAVNEEESQISKSRKEIERVEVDDESEGKSKENCVNKDQEGWTEGDV